jgi:hypothetical protein
MINLQDLGTIFSSLPGRTSQQELFISPLDNATTLDSQNAYPSAPRIQYSVVSSMTPPISSSAYSGSPAPSDFSLPLHAPQPQRLFEASSQTKSNMATLDVDMMAYAQGLASFNIPLDMGLSYAVPEMTPSPSRPISSLHGGCPALSFVEAAESTSWKSPPDAFPPSSLLI